MPRTSKRHWTKTQRGNWSGGRLVPTSSSILFQQLEKSDNRNALKLKIKPCSFFLHVGCKLKSVHSGVVPDDRHSFGLWLPVPTELIISLTEPLAQFSRNRSPVRSPARHNTAPMLSTDPTSLFQILHTER